MVENPPKPAHERLRRTTVKAVVAHAIVPVLLFAFFKWQGRAWIGNSLPEGMQFLPWASVAVIYVMWFEIHCFALAVLTLTALLALDAWVSYRVRLDGDPIHIRLWGLAVGLTEFGAVGVILYGLAYPILTLGPP